MKYNRLFGTIALSSVLLTGATACSGNSQTPSPAVEQTQTEASITRAEPGLIYAEEMEISLASPASFTEDNYLSLDGQSKISINKYGTLETDKLGNSPAEGEVFHAINYFADSMIESATLDIEGKTKQIEWPLPASGTLVVSAPENASLALKLTTDGITQSIDLKTAERLSEGLADAWYMPSKAKITGGNINEKKNLDGNTVTMKAKISSANKEANYAGYGWADEGKKAWLVIDAGVPEWELPDTSAYASDESHKLWLTDDEGNEYETESEWSDGFNGAEELVFEVPTDTSVFYLHTDNSLVVSDFGSKVAEIESLKTRPVKIEFGE